MLVFVFWFPLWRKKFTIDFDDDDLSADLCVDTLTDCQRWPMNEMRKYEISDIKLADQDETFPNLDVKTQTIFGS